MDISAQDQKHILDICRSMTPVFVDGEEEQSLQLFPDRKPFHLSAVNIVNAEDLPGGGGHQTLRANYADSQEGFEPLMTAVLRYIAARKPEITLFDVGAEYGLTSLVTATLFDKANLHIFEMNPFTHRAMRRNLALNRHLPAHCHFNQVLLSDNNGMSEVVFRHYTAKVVGASEGKKISDSKILITRIRNRLKKLVGIKSRGDFLRAQFKEQTIDAYCEEHKATPQVIKIDVEGSQYKILKGAVNTLKHSRPILLVEFDAPGSANDIGRSNREILKFIGEFGYKCVWGHHRIKNTDLQPIDADTKLDIEVNSLAVFYHPDFAF